ncbi:hypothetical protein TcasGA2_TC011358 [Tribolium castaneum]|uniref:Uncharacterized protein n=1 Tax=Tribolium castaneum TaxID=7070 RepID=D6X468_TRICA|nr:PREDICTED: uncharacterized protein LOC103314434 [Tribolium castaneum]XP_015839839.1 PREDICTED: uncharacterized protein LOC103314434 [Tribolium castaneum]EEZ97513.2 hypothetical protein TcasGA2_TC011358 [Tribolium castaneum]|eukprot:XP_008198735.1 PREDICTED: uncharacterized protein LOC103314434 [Tribolium castaneum]
MSIDEVFYDSLEEDNEEIAPPPVDLTQTVPLYTGDIAKEKITRYINRKTDKSAKPVPNPLKPKKSYLSMYYARKNPKNKQDGSVTSRAICEKLSPKRESDLDTDLQGLNQTEFLSDSDQDEFYENFMALEIQKKSLCDEEPKINTSEKSLKLSPKNDKLELWKKKQSYGMKMTLKNRIKIHEVNSIRKIKNSKKNLYPQ